MQHKFSQNTPALALVLLLIAASSSSSGLFVNALKVTEYSETARLVQSDRDNMFVVFVSSSDEECERCKIGNEMFEKFNSEYGFIKSHLVDCAWQQKKNAAVFEYENVRQVCENINALPHVTFFEPESEDKSRQWPKDSVFSGLIEPTHLAQHAQKLIDGQDYVHEVNSARDVRVFLDDPRHALKVLYASHDTETPLMLRFMSIQYRRHIGFAFLDKDNEKVFKDVPELRADVKGAQILLVKRNYETGKDEKRVLYAGSPVENDKYYEIEKFLTAAVRAHLEASGSGVTRAQDLNKDIMSLQVHTVTPQGFTRFLPDTDFWFLVQFGALTDRFHALRERFQHLFKYFQVQCGDASADAAACADFAAQKFGISDVTTKPHILVYPVGKKEAGYFIRVNPEHSDEELARILVNYVQPLDRSVSEYAREKQELIDHFAQPALQANTFPIVWFIDTADVFQRLYMQTFANMPRYRDIFRFAKVTDPQPDQLEYWEIPHGLPYALAVLEVKGHSFQRAAMNQQRKDFGDFLQFIENLAERQRLELTRKDPIKNVNNPDDFDKYCKGAQICAIGVLQQYKDGRFKLETDALEELKTRYVKQKFVWGWLDGNCHPELLSALSVDRNKLSQFFVYNHKKKKFRVLNSEFSEDSIADFIDTLYVKTNKKNWVQIDEGLEIEDSECDAINARLRETAEAEKNKKREEQRAKNRAKARQEL